MKKYKTYYYNLSENKKYKEYLCYCEATCSAEALYKAIGIILDLSKINIRLVADAETNEKYIEKIIPENKNAFAKERYANSIIVENYLFVTEDNDENKKDIVTYHVYYCPTTYGWTHTEKRIHLGVFETIHHADALYQAIQKIYTIDELNKIGLYLTKNKYGQHVIEYEGQEYYDTIIVNQCIFFTETML